MKGKCKWFDDTKGFGFIGTEGEKDIFVHYSSIQMTGRKTLKENDPVEFEIEQSERGPRAVNVVKVNA